MSMPEITLVLGIDAATIEQLKVSWPTWKKNRPEMWNWPCWIIFYDRNQLSQQDVLDLAELMQCPSPTMFVAWPPPGSNPTYQSQRERMLTGHVFVPAMHCRTAYAMKLDTDALARPHDSWIDPTWFSERPSVVAPRWSYTKGAGWLGSLEEWGETALPDYPALGCREWPNYSPTDKRVGHARWCSWCSYYERQFLALCASLFEKTLGPFKLPVPSHDTSLWYCSERMKRIVVKANQKRRGWSNHPNSENLKRTAAEIMACSSAPQC